MTPPTDRDRERARELALRHIPEVGSQWPLAPGDRVVLCDSLRDAIVAALAEERARVEARCIALARGVCSRLDAAGRGGEASARSEGARAVLKALTGEDVPVEAQRAVEGL